MRRISIFVIVIASVCFSPAVHAAGPPKVVAASAGSAFDEVGKVTLYVGQPCTSQIVFVFHAAKSTTIEMAAPFHESKILTDAAHRHRTVHVSGRWRPTKQAGCTYVEVTQVEVEKTFWEKLRGTFGSTH
jgi:hypothetical protein